jgi:peptide methionine sulfoxide reductase MsrB
VTNFVDQVTTRFVAFVVSIAMKKLCGNVMCSSSSKFRSHCGWPAFSAVKTGADSKDGNVARNLDDSHGMVRTEVTCTQVSAHVLGLGLG